MAFAANNAAAAAANAQAQYMNTPSFSAPGITCLGSQPSCGQGGTKVFLKIQSQYDLMTMTPTAPYCWVLFGDQRCSAHIMREGQDASGACTYNITTDAPNYMVTNWQSPSNVPVSLIIESAEGSEIARVESAGSFTYTDSQASVSSGAASPHDDGSVTRRGSRSPEHEHRASPPQLTVRTSATTSPANEHHGQQLTPVGPQDVSTNTFGYPPAGVAQAQSSFTPATAYNQGNDTMLGAYRTTNYHHQHYPRGASALRSPHHSVGGWNTYGGLDGRSPGSYGPSSHTSITRPGLTPSLPVPNAGTPQLIRTSTIQQSGPGTGMSSNPYNPYALYSSKAVLTIQGNLDSMAQDWTQEEWDNRRRIVIFKKTQVGSRLNASFRPVSVNERPPNSICISCIWWAEKQECFVTSVDTIHLLEQLVAAPARFTVEEKNRIRRNLEGFKPLTVSKAKADSEEFFKIIMGFGNPKPRNIEKDVKVFPWKILSQALKKIIGKYSASPSSTLPPTTPTHLLTPVSVSGASYPLPPTPGSTTTATDPTSATGYISAGVGSHGSMADTIPSPRSLPGSASSAWPAYPGSAVSRTLSPVVGLKPASPNPTSSLRISTLPAVYDTRGSQSLTSPYGLPQGHSTHHGQVPQSHSSRWDYGGVDASTGVYGGGAHGAHHGVGHGVYSGAYGESAQRA